MRGGVSAGFKAQPVYKAKGPLPGRKRRNGFLGNQKCLCLRLRHTEGSVPEPCSRCIQCPLEYAAAHSCGQDSSEGSTSPREHLSVFLRHRDSGGRLSFVFLFWSETSCPSKLYSCSGSQLPPSPSFLAQERFWYTNWHNREEFELFITFF